jgi:hypothetical protein
MAGKVVGKTEGKTQAIGAPRLRCVLGRAKDLYGETLTCLAFNWAGRRAVRNRMLEHAH